MQYIFSKCVILIGLHIFVSVLIPIHVKIHICDCGQIIVRFGQQAPNCWALSSVAGGSWWPGRARRGCGSWQLHDSCGSWAAALPATEHALPVSSGRAHTLDLGSSHLQMSAMSIATLLQAAEYLDRRERGEQLFTLGRGSFRLWQILCIQHGRADDGQLMEI